MPPSPLMRVSPKGGVKAENHKRGRSLESLDRDKDDDLALFSEVRNRERDNFLLQTNDNFDDILSLKLRNFSDYKFGISIPARGETSDLLNADRDKNDYDWLMTPPETPLFRSLDDEVKPVKHISRGRPTNQPVSISRSPTMEKDYKSGRGNASPHRLSPSRYNTLQSRSRPFSATHSSPPHTTRHLSPARRLSTPPSKPTSTRRSITPTPRRLSTSLPKTRAWQNIITGFSLDSPPNLRTSLTNRPYSNVRGVSPISRYGTASRSVASSYRQFDDDIDSPQSILFGQSPRNVGGYPSNNGMSFSRKPMKEVSNSAPERSFDLVNQTDCRGPQNMSRPLLSSFAHAGETSAHNRAQISRNSSTTTSSNATSDQAACGVNHTELNEEELTSPCMKGHYPDMDDELFVVDCIYSLNEDIENRITDESLGENDELPVVISQLDVGSSNIVDAPYMGKCSRCGRILQSDEVVTEIELQSCLDCRCLKVRSVITDPPKIVIEEVFDECSGKIHFDTENLYSDSSQSLCVEVFEEGGPSLASEEMTKQAMDEINSISNIDVTEGACVSLLLKRSSSLKRNLVQSMSFTASTTSYDDFSYVNSISASLSSSTDMGSSTQTEFRSLLPLRCRESDNEDYRYEIHKRPISSTPSCDGDSFEVIGNKEACVDSMEVESNCGDIERICVLKTASMLSSHVKNDYSGENETHSPASNEVDDAAEVHSPSSLNPISEIEIENNEVRNYDSNSDVDSSNSRGCDDAGEEFETSQHENGGLEESKILLGEMADAAKAKSFILEEEAEDVILFCSSIVHSLANKAANIAVDNEVEDSQPAVMFVGRSSFERRDTRLNICSSIARKARKKSIEMETTPSSPRILGPFDDRARLNPPKLYSKCNCTLM